MKVLENDIKWLRTYFPGLHYNAETQRIVGELDFWAFYDEETRLVKYEADSGIRELKTSLCDVFEIEIHLDSESLGKNGWPKVYEIGGRYARIAEENNLDPIDLHFFDDGSCCLGIRYAREKNLTLERLLYHLVIPFFYRLSYAEQYGIKAAQTELWGEYSHGDRGHKEHTDEMLRFPQRGLGRNAPCPCGSGAKFKRCCQDEVNEVMRRLSPPIQSKTG